MIPRVIQVNGYPGLTRAEIRNWRDCQREIEREIEREYVVRWNGTLETQAVKAQQRPAALVQTLSFEQRKRDTRQARQRVLAVLRSQPSHWWSISDVLTVLGDGTDRTWVNTLLRDFCWRGLAERMESRGPGRQFRYRARG